MNKAKGAHFSGLKLSLALVLGLLLVPAYVVAPVLFTELESVQAGLIAGKIFYMSNLAILILLVSAAVFAYRIQVKKSTWYLLGLVGFMVAINVFGVTNMMSMIKAEAGDISALADDDPLRWAFAFWHGMGSILQLISSLLVVVLVMRNDSSHTQETQV
ncbi:DUF4149 domain-containing protein [Ghiorsea bivora]|uniref:DUF4149 domain-containing protein n=1 Tax=Ghiorsea bivora TaxID=1485545 RepID=UPI0012FD6126|nr:DUF4149 domain-containing protein [Ghiorsea bivora]